MTDDQLAAKGSLACEMEVAVALARALREQQTLLQSTDIGVAFIQKRAIQRCNQQFAEIFGFPDSASLLGQASYLLHPSRDAFRALGRDAFAEMAQGRTFRSVRQMRRKDGSLFWASLTGRFINSEAPSEGSIWTLDDVDAQILMRSKLDAIQLQTQILLDHAMVGVVYVREHKVVQCNRHAEQMLGYAPGQLCGQAARDGFASDSDWAAQLADYAPTLAMGKVFSAELNLRRQDGAELICETRSKALDDGSTVWIFMDITERCQTQEALRQAHAELKREVDEEQLDQQRRVTRQLHIERHQARQVRRTKHQQRSVDQRHQQGRGNGDQADLQRHTHGLEKRRQGAEDKSEIEGHVQSISPHG